ncbi:MAG: hypothetical protein GQ527_07185, partial [Bacteroidales bacterium]|nr:hypothetical protein [Bacteroidales bacterium]
MRFYLIIIGFLFSASTLAQYSLIINEASSRNTTIITDEDDDFEDWLEIYNGDTISKNLSQYYLSDDKDIPMMWKFPEIILEPQDYLLVFASKKDRKPIINHWESVLSGDSLWKYKNPSELNESSYDYVYWSETNYDDTDWLSGNGAFGVGYDQIQTPTSDTLRTIHLRAEFHIEDTSKILSAVIHAYYDDGFVAYLNGYQILRINMKNDGLKQLYFPTDSKSIPKQEKY